MTRVSQHGNVNQRCFCHVDKSKSNSMEGDEGEEDESGEECNGDESDGEDEGNEGHEDEEDLMRYLQPTIFPSLFYKELIVTSGWKFLLLSASKICKNL